MEYNFTSTSFTKNGEPWFPIMGEFHYSRYQKEYWIESLNKMKAGGVDVVSTYVIWIHHEEEENVYDFEGNKNLRAFVQACEQVGLPLFLRIGPWSHGEVRNGGFPDWLMKKPFELRANNDEYFSCVKKFYKKIYEQVDGYLFGQRENAPIIGIQIENEYGHCGGLQGEEGEKHIKTLYSMAKKIGFDVPYYTATGWGGAITGGLIPVMGGYCEAPWDQRLTEIEPSGNYIFTYERNDHNIGSDFGFGEGITFDISKFPYLTAELGGGLQVTHHRRPVTVSSDIGVMSLVKIGSGVNLLGYYMYHGGTNPKGKFTTLQETKETGMLNNLPAYNYDFRAPIGEYGRISDTYKELKLLTMFVKDFGSDLCTKQAVIKEDNPLYATDLTHLRYTYRMNGKSGYVFINNYQRHQKMADHKNQKISVDLEDGSKIEFPPINIEDKDYFFLPFNFLFDGIEIEYALATPLCVLHNTKNILVFYKSLNQKTNEIPDDKLYSIKNRKKDIEILTLTREQALNSYKLYSIDGLEYLFVTTANIIPADEGANVRFLIHDENDCKVKIYPQNIELEEKISEYLCSVYQKQNEKINATFEFSYEDEKKVVYDIKIDNLPKLVTKDGIADVFVTFDYVGDKAQLLINDDVLSDHFFVGTEFPWQVGLKQWCSTKKLVKKNVLTLEIDKLSVNDKIYLENWPNLPEKPYASLDQMIITSEVSVVLPLFLLK